MRIEIIYTDFKTDGRARRVLHNLQNHVSDKIEDLVLVDVYLTDCSALTKKQAAEIFCDPVAQSITVDRSAAETIDQYKWDYLIEITYKAGVTNPVAITAREAIESELEIKLDPETRVQTAVQYLVKCKTLDESELKKLKGYLYNNLIQRASVFSGTGFSGNSLPAVYDNTVAPSDMNVLDYDITSMSIEQLNELSKVRLLALSEDELQTIKKYYADPETIKNRKKAGLSVNATDLETNLAFFIKIYYT